MGKVTIDIGPKKKNVTQTGIKGTFKPNCPKGYTKYEYTKSGGSFELSGFSYNSTSLKIISTPIKNVKKVNTYFQSDTFIALHIDSDKEQVYYTTTNTNSIITGSSVFADFVTIGQNKSLNEESQLKPILDSIVKNTKLYYERLSTSIKDEFWRGGDIVFDLTKSPLTNGYNSELTDVVISPEKSDTKITGYNKVQHSIGTEPFWARKVKFSGGDIQLGDEVPNVPIREFNAYYSTSDTNYGNPLLVTLTIKQPEDVDQSKYIPNKYLLSKNHSNANWDIRRIDGSLEEINDELGKVLKNISTNQKLTVDGLSESVQKKLIDIRKDLVINLSGPFPAEHGNSVGSYDSEGKKIYYKKYTGNGYTRIKHCYTFSGFTISSIKFDGNYRIDTKNLPLKDTPIKNFEVYYNGTSSTEDPLMVYILYGDYRQRWLYRYSGDLVWTVVGGEGQSGQSSMNEKDIIDILSERTIPKVSIDLAKPGDKSYNPIGNTLTFTVSIEHNPASSGFFQFIHTRSENKQFRIIQITHNGSRLEGIYPQEVLTSVSGFYPEYTPSDPTKLLLVEIVDINNKYMYYCRDENGNKWIKLEREGAGKLEKTDLRNQLEKLKKESSYGSESKIIPSSQSSSSNFSKPGAISGVVIGCLVLTLAAVLLVRRYRYQARIRLFKEHPLL